MAHTHQQPEPSPQSLRKGYEEDDLTAASIVWFVVIFIIFAIAVHLGIWYTLKNFSSRRRAVDQPQSALTAEAPLPTPPLQPTQRHDQLPAQDMEAMRQHEDAVFEQLGWQVDPKTHQVQIPNDVVKRLAQTPGGAR